MNNLLKALDAVRALTRPITLDQARAAGAVLMLDEQKRQQWEDWVQKNGAEFIAHLNEAQG